MPTSVLSQPIISPYETWMKIKQTSDYKLPVMLTSTSQLLHLDRSVLSPFNFVSWWYNNGIESKLYTHFTHIAGYQSITFQFGFKYS